MLLAGLPCGPLGDSTPLLLENRCRCVCERVAFKLCAARSLFPRRFRAESMARKPCFRGFRAESMAAVEQADTKD